MTFFVVVFLNLLDKRQVVLFGVIFRNYVSGLLSPVLGSLVLECITLSSLVNIFPTLMPYSSIIVPNKVFLVLSLSNVYLFSCRA